jgi:thiamine monophosphate synthase
VALGLSAHAHDDPARWAEVDYLVFGPVRATPKDPPFEPVGLAGLARAVEHARAAPPHAIPVYAIGGLAPADAGDVLAAGARGIFALRGVLGAADPAAAVRAYLAAFDPARERPCNGGAAR